MPPGCKRGASYFLWVAVAAAQGQNGFAKRDVMRIEMERFSFEIPAGFEDTTSYTFKDRKDLEVLTVTFGTRPIEATNLRSLMSLRRRNLDVVMPGAAKIEAETDTRVDGLAGRMLTFTFEDRKITFRERWAVALPTPEMYLQVSYVAPASDGKAETRFSHICQSVVAAQKTPLAATPEGYVRRWARRMTLDVPASLAPPRVYQFVAKDDGGIQLLVQYHNPRSADAPMPTLQEDLAQDAARGAIGDHQSQGITGSYGSGSLTAYSVTPAGDAGVWAYVADLVLGNGVRMRASLHGPRASEARLRQVIERFVPAVVAK